MNEPKVLVERRGHVLLIGLNRPQKRNAADNELLCALAEAYGQLEHDPEARVGLVYAIGDHFTAGLDLVDLEQHITPNGLSFIGETGVDPWGVSGVRRTKPIVVAVQGACLTLGVELVLASDIAVAARSTRFGQIEVSRGLLPFGGATIRFPRAAGWGNAMRYMLTGDSFDAAEAYRIGLVQEVVDDGLQFDTALAIAEKIAAQAPLAVQAVLTNAMTAAHDNDGAAEADLQPALVRLAASEDARIGMRAFLSRTTAGFVGR